MTGVLMVGKRAGRWVISGNDIIDYTIVNFGTFFSLGRDTKKYIFDLSQV
jgi:hypothetical protein